MVPRGLRYKIPHFPRPFSLSFFSRSPPRGEIDIHSLPSTATMLHLKGKQEPRWVWRYRRQRETLAAIIESLNGEESFDPVTDLKMQQCRIQIAPLDFHSGATTSSSTQYFRLRDGVQLWKGSEQMKKHSPYFKTLQKIKRKSSMPQAEKDLHIQRALAESFETARILASVNGERFTEFQSFE